MKKIRVRLKERSYGIIIGKGLLDRAGAFLRRLNLGDTAVVLTNRRLASLFGNRIKRSLARCGIESLFELIPDSERAKSYGVAIDILSRMPARAKKKRPFIAVVGGGVAGDLGGFVASVYKRGVPYVQIPTTLLAQVDSSIGGKTAIDLPAAKNLIGAFYQPRLVLSDVSVLKSLPRREVTSGLAEIIKYGVIKDRQLFCRVEDGLGDLLSLNEKTLEGIISRCGSIKAGIVERDEFDRKGCRAILNYGHTIGHAIEAASGYGGRYSHGEAVALGMLVANAIAVKIGLLKEADADRIGSLIARAGLPTAIRGLSPKVIYESHLHDKKFEGRKNRFILPVSIGRVRVVEGVRRDVIEASIRERVAP